MKQQFYRVATHVFGIEADEKYLALLTNYAPFEIAPEEAAPLFNIHVHEEPLPTSEGWSHVYTDRSDEDMPRIEMYERPDAWLFAVSVLRESEIECVMECAKDWKDVQLYMKPRSVRFAIDNTAMLVYAFSTADKSTLLFHSSVTVRDGKGYMFLGHSGTGKSTHSQQWKAAFEDATLLNDDNPAVKISEDGEVRVYGTPWSGKTPCYKNDSAKVAALVQLAQAPQNKIERMKMTKAYPFILASVSGMKIMPETMDRIYESIARLLELIPVYHLECLPNPDAARLCAQTCSL